ncbi:MAG: MarR family winged helix-turn-helix transcriptional regulator [Anaerovoracaceae bacterium]
MNERQAYTADLAFFRIVSKRYHEFAKKELNEYEFTPNEIATMIYLMENDDIDTAKAISDRFHITQSLICRSVDSLTKKGYIKTEIDADDRRVNHLTLHIEDENLKSILENLNKRYIDKIFSNMSQEEIDSFHDNLKKIEAMMNS